MQEKASGTQRNWKAMLLMVVALLAVGLMGVIVRYGWPPSFLGGGLSTQAPGDIGGQGGFVSQLPTSTGPRPTPDCGAGAAWRVVDSPNLVPQETGPANAGGAPPGGDPGEPDEKGGNNLYDVAAVSAQDVWAVGYRHGGGSLAPLVEHWDGKAWSIAYIRNVVSTMSLLNSVAALPHEAWAVGAYTTQQRATLPLIEHWDGTQWTVASAAPVDSTYALFNGVAARSADDVWAVGYYSDAQGTYHTLAQHWDGKEWRMTPTPNVGNVLNMLTSVSARSADDAWAVGYYVGAKSNYQTLTLHWNGKEWSIVGSPSPGTVTNYLYDVTIAGPQDVWAVGYTFNGNGPTLALVLHWDGKQWATMQSPPLQSSYVVLNGSSIAPGGGLWVAGMYLDKNRVYRSLVARWDGTTWGAVASPGAGVDLSNLKSVSALSPTDAWAVGYHNITQGTSSTLTAHYSNPCPMATR